MSTHFGDHCVGEITIVDRKYGFQILANQSGDMAIVCQEIVCPTDFQDPIPTALCVGDGEVAGNVAGRETFLTGRRVNASLTSTLYP
ncbi:hypothetical protein SCAR479_04017 [Seiridium cardinale]|uniref:Uncharacterized protein n=1 Tax=Seiridium cardinale TaxID=138064 RepID=A0ABR2XZM0_9PEZI